MTIVSETTEIEPAGAVDSVLPRTADSSKSDANFVVLPNYWIQEFDTCDERKSKAGKTRLRSGGYVPAKGKKLES